MNITKVGEYTINHDEDGIASIEYPEITRDLPYAGALVFAEEIIKMRELLQAVADTDPYDHQDIYSVITRVQTYIESIPK